MASQTLNQMLEPTRPATLEATPLEIPVKEPKKRGRKPKNPKSDAKETIQNTPKKRPRKKKIEISQDSIKMQIMGAHAVLNVMVPGSMISETNAEAEAREIKNVIDIYGMDWLMKYLPILSLVGTIAFCEMPTAKAVAEFIREKRKKSEKGPVVGIIMGGKNDE